MDEEGKMDEGKDENEGKNEPSEGNILGKKKKDRDLVYTIAWMVSNVAAGEPKQTTLVSWQEREIPTNAFMNGWMDGMRDKLRRGIEKKSIFGRKGKEKR